MSEQDRINGARNAARYFTENRHLSWVLLAATILFGVYGYVGMPKRKDPVLTLHYVVAVCAWPGAGAEKIEQLITRRMEEKISENSKVDLITSLARNGVTVVEARIQEDITESAKEFDDLKVRLDSLKDLPDGAGPIEFFKDFGQTAALMLTVATDKYSYRQLEEFTDLIKRTLQNVPQASKVSRSGILPEQVTLEYSQERLASVGVSPSVLYTALGARNISLPGGRLEVDGKNLAIDPSGEFKSEREIGDVVIASSMTGTPVYLRDVVDIQRGYQNPPNFLNFYTGRDAAGGWRRMRAITLAVNMRDGEQIGEFGKAVDAALASIKDRLPEDLVLARTSDQPQQVREIVSLFMQSLLEAIVLVVLVALIGFREWRSALLIAISIPLTLATSFGFMHLAGLDLQQVSISTLIIALGLLVDDPVVAGDAIKRELAAGRPPEVAAWLGPTKLARAIMFATITNIVAYLPFLMLSGDAGGFFFSMPVTLTITLLASRWITMSFIPLLGMYLLKSSRTPEPSLEERRRRGISGWYYRIGGYSIDHRWRVVGVSLLILIGGFYLMTRLKTQYFAKDLSYLSYLDVWLPEDASLSATDEAAARAENVIREVAADYGRRHPSKDGKPREVLESLTTFVGGGGPRFWISVAPEMRQLNYAQVLIRVKDKHDTQPLVTPLQQALSATIPGARIDMRQLETGKNFGVPVSFRISGEDIGVLRDIAGQVKNILSSVPEADRVRDDWGVSSFTAKLQIDADRASLAEMSNLDVAVSSAVALSGLPVTTLREGNEQIPVVVRMRREERAAAADLQNLYVHSLKGEQKVPLGQLSSVEYKMVPEKLWRRNHFRAITVSCFPVPGVLASQVFNAAWPRIEELSKKLSPGYKVETGGEQEEQGKGFSELAVVMGVIIGTIFLMLVIQFRNAVKPLIVFAAIPFGMVGAIIGLAVTQTPFGFMAFLGISSLIGVIISHIIVLFDFIEEMREEGKPLREALLDAGIVRLRPVMVTVGATVFGLVPLSLNGGPLWEPLCYAQIGGLIFANYITKLLVPALYAICVLDLKLIRWEKEEQPGAVQTLSTSEV